MLRRGAAERILEHPADQRRAAVLRPAGHVLSVEADRALVGVKMPATAPSRRGLPRAVGAQHDDEGAPLDGEVDPLRARASRPASRSGRLWSRPDGSRARGQPRGTRRARARAGTAAAPRPEARAPANTNTAVTSLSAFGSRPARIAPAMISRNSTAPSTHRDQARRDAVAAAGQRLAQHHARQAGHDHAQPIWMFAKPWYSANSAPASADEPVRHHQPHARSFRPP